MLPKGFFDISHTKKTRSKANTQINGQALSIANILNPAPGDCSAPIFVICIRVFHYDGGGAACATAVWNGETSPQPRAWS